MTLPYPDLFSADIAVVIDYKFCKKITNPFTKRLGRVKTLPYNYVWKSYFKLQYYRVVSAVSDVADVWVGAVEGTVDASGFLKPRM